MVDLHVGGGGGRPCSVSFVIDHLPITFARASGLRVCAGLCRLYQGSFGYISVIVLRRGFDSPP
jgi:hypothetical protein